MKYSRLFFIGFFIVFFSFQQERYPQDYFRSPVGNTLRLSGTFGELRPNHFHAGIDIKGAVGHALYAIADGFVSRIKVQEEGYGNVIYIDHPNGYTSVYAHLDQFSPDVEKYVKSIQYQKQSFEVEAYPETGQFQFEKGEKIGTMGVSGRSFGPHLHFEIRDTKTEKAINPLLFGLKVADSRHPRMHQLKLYGLNETGETTFTKTISLQKGNGANYRVSKDTVYIKSDYSGVALKVYDHMNGVTNWNGIYSLSMYVDDSIHYQFEMETLAFDESRYLNAHLDYEEQVTQKSYFNRCFVMPGNSLSIYEKVSENGRILLNRTKARKVELVAKDIEGNDARLRFWLKQSSGEKTSDSKNYTYLLPYAEESLIETSSLRIFFPKGTLYENLYLQYASADEQSDGIYSSIHHIHDYKTPVHKYYELSIRPQSIPEALRSKAFIAYCTPNNTVINCGGQWEGDLLKTKVRDLGVFYVAVDDKAPTITPHSFQRDMTRKSRMTFRIQDNFSTARNVKGLQYKGTIDGQWVLMEFDAKNDMLVHKFEEELAVGEHQLRLEVWDALGNLTVFEKDFVR